MSLLTCSAVPPLSPSLVHDPGEVCGEGLGQLWDGGVHPISGSDLLSPAAVVLAQGTSDVQGRQELP